MYVLKMDGGKELITTVRQSVYQGEKNADTLIILVPKLYDNFDMTTGSGTLQYMLPDTDAYVDLELTPTEHNAEYMAYTTQLGAPITSATGIVLMRLQIKDADGNVILVSGNASLPILCRDGTIPDVSAQDKDKLARLAEQVGLLKQENAVLFAKPSLPQMSADTVGKYLLNDGEKAQWQDMSPLIVNITKDGQDASGNPIYKSDKTFDEIKAAYDTGREIKLGEIGDFDSSTFQYYCGSEPKLVSVSDNSVGFLGTGNTTALLNNALNLVSQYGGLPTLFTSIEIRKAEKGDVVEVSSSFTIDSEKGQIVFEPEAITTLSLGSANLIPVAKTDKGLECGVADETVLP